MAGVSARGSGRVVVADSAVTSGRASGVHISEDASATVEHCRVEANGLCGVELSGSAATLVARRNVVRGNGGEAFALPSPQCGGCVQLEGNDLG